jgi:Type IV secretion system pilin
MMKKAISIFILTATILLTLPMQVVAEPDAGEIGTLLPNVDSGVDCKKILNDLELGLVDPKDMFAQGTLNKNEILACAIKTGRVKFWMVPYFVVYFIDFLIKISGLIAVLFIVIGGYKYVVAGATDDKDGAKSTITNAILGLVVVLTAWSVINMIQFALTF